MPEEIEGQGEWKNSHHLVTPAEINAALAVLLQHEEHLSDGFGYYIPYHPDFQGDREAASLGNSDYERILRSIVREMLIAAEQAR